ncbi:MAG: SLC13 family permease [Rhodocyclaceae bacterium]
MSTEQIAIVFILLATVAAFLWGRWRHDVVAASALLACVFVGLVPADQAFAGFGHPAVITVACVLVLSFGLQDSGAIDALARRLLPTSAGPVATLAALTGLGAGLSAFMNNVGALALLMPIALQLATRQKRPPGRLLMPLAFGTILGGMVTMIGTPPNLIVAGFRESAGLGSFRMFDFTPVGLAVAALGVAFVATVGWRLVPARGQVGGNGFDTAAYLTEVRVVEDGPALGRSLAAIERQLDEADAQVIGLVRNDVRISAPSRRHRLRAGDILVIEAEPEGLAVALSGLGLALEEAVLPDDAAQDDAGTGVARNQAAAPEVGTKPADGDDPAPDEDETLTQELVAMPHGHLVGRSATDIALRTRYGLNLLAVSRQGNRSVKRLRATRIEAGDVLLMQGPAQALSAFAAEFGCVPLAEREIRIPDRRRATLSGGLMSLAVAAAATGLLPAAVAFAAAVVAFMLLRIIALRKVYEAVDWPVVVLLAALMPVAGAMADTGTADLVAKALLDDVARGQPVVALTLVLVVTMVLSDFMNNAATAAVMCPIAISTASQLGASSDAFLMAVAIGASCAFLTPIGHQNNTLILGPGGFRFGDYWRLGLPLEILVVAIGVPMLLWVWPL